MMLTIDADGEGSLMCDGDTSEVGFREQLLGAFLFFGELNSCNLFMPLGNVRTKGLGSP